MLKVCAVPTGRIPDDEGKRSCLFVLCALAAPVLLFVVLFAPFEQRPPLLRNLPSDISAADVEFSRRIQTQFPPGSNEQALETALLEAGFERIGDRAMQREARSLCGLHFGVSWRVTENDRIKDVSSSAGVTCF